MGANTFVSGMQSDKRTLAPSHRGNIMLFDEVVDQIVTQGDEFGKVLLGSLKCLGRHSQTQMDREIGHVLHPNVANFTLAQREQKITGKGPNQHP